MGKTVLWYVAVEHSHSAHYSLACVQKKGWTDSKTMHSTYLLEWSNGFCNSDFQTSISETKYTLTHTQTHDCDSSLSLFCSHSISLEPNVHVFENSLCRCLTYCKWKKNTHTEIQWFELARTLNTPRPFKWKCVFSFSNSFFFAHRSLL